jgi:hypothetical protein
VNQLWEHCLQHGLQFPLKIRHAEPMEQDSA